MSPEVSGLAARAEARAADRRTVRIGTRGSALALAQAALVVEALPAGQRHDVVVVETAGDRRAPDTAWGEGAFVAAIEAALLDDRVDVAVHSAKDVPTEEDPRLAIAAYLPRADAADALVVRAGSPVRSLAELPAGSRVGTDSPRRAGFLRAHRPDLEVRPLHGNVDTRLRRLDGGEVEALVLAVAGLARLGRTDRITERLPAELIPPAPGQGAIALQVRRDGAATAAAIAALDHGPTRLAVEAERAFLRAAGGGCRAPIGALATVADGRVSLLGGFAALGRAAVDTIEAPTAEFPAIAAALAASLAARLPRRPRVLVTRPAEQADRLADALREEGVEPVIVPAIAVVPAEPGGQLDTEIGRLREFRWTIVTSANGARAALAAARSTGAELTTGRWAAVGNATADVLREAGVSDVWLPSHARATGIAEELPVEPGDRVLLVRGSAADGRLPTGLRARGATVDEVEAYRTVEAPAASRPILREALEGLPPTAVLFASGSAVRGLLALAGSRHRDAVLDLPAIVVGPETSSAAREAGFDVVGEATDPSTHALARLTGDRVSTRLGEHP